MRIPRGLVKIETLYFSWFKISKIYFKLNRLSLIFFKQQILASFLRVKRFATNLTNTLRNPKKTKNFKNGDPPTLAHGLKVGQSMDLIAKHYLEIG
jgi:hypothetical protein